MKHLEVTRQKYHMQGFTTDGKYMYWSFTNTLVKTTMTGTVVAQKEVPIMSEHLGGIDYHNGRIYGAAMGNSLKGDPWGQWTSFTVHVYDAESLSLVKVMRLDDCYRDHAACRDGFDGVGAITAGVDAETGEEALFIAAGMKNGAEITRQIVLQYGFDGKLQKRHFVPTGAVNIGVQNIDFDPDTHCFWLTTYDPTEAYHVRETLFCASPDLASVVKKYAFSTPYGFHCCGGGRFYASLQYGKNGARGGFAYEVGEALLAEVDKDPQRGSAINAYVMPRFDAEQGL